MTDAADACAWWRSRGGWQSMLAMYVQSAIGYVKAHLVASCDVEGAHERVERYGAEVDAGQQRRGSKDGR